MSGNGKRAVVSLILSIALTAVMPHRASAAPAAPAAKETAQVYDESADAKADVAAAVQRAAADNKRVLLDIGGNWCGWCRLLHTLFTGDKDTRELLNAEYEVVYVDIAHGEKNRDLLASYGINAHSYPYLAVLDANNKLVTQQETGALEAGPKHDPAKVKAFLEKNKAPAQDARSVLDAALSQASAEGKQVFLHFGAPWCGWCHRLEDVLAQPAVAHALPQDLVLVKIDIDRMTGGKDLQGKYQASGGIPWYAILRPDGTVVSTSEIKPGSNIGFPTEPEEIDHVMKMLTTGRKHMTDDQVAAVRDAFTRAAAAVKAKLQEQHRAQPPQQPAT